MDISESERAYADKRPASARHAQDFLSEEIRDAEALFAKSNAGPIFDHDLAWRLQVRTRISL